MTTDLYPCRSRVSEHFYSLDLLRFLMAVCIAFYHFAGYFPLNIGSIDTFLNNYTKLLVEVFFHISGFLLAAREDRIANTSFLSFSLSRAARLLPVYWITLLIHTVINRAMGFPVGIFFFLSNALLMPYRLVEPLNLLNLPSWFLLTLLLCYWVFWLIVHGTKRRGFNPVPLYAVFLIIGLMARQQTAFFGKLNVSVTRGFIGFFGGCLLFHLSRVISGRKAVITGLCIWGGVIGLRLISVDYLYNRYIPTVLLLIPSLLLIMTNSERLEKRLPRRLCMFLGRIAFPIYLLDASFLTCLKGVMTRYVPQNRQGSIGMMLLSTAVLVLIAVMIHVFLEKPLIVLFSKAVQTMTVDEPKEVPHDC